MTLENFYYLSQIFAVLALFVSILFVGFQIRQNTKAIRATSHHAITDSFNQINSLLMGDPSLARLWRVGLTGLKNLNENEQISFGYMLLGYSRIFETLYYQYKNGTMDRKLFEAELKTLKWAAGNPGFREWWASNPISLGPDYREFMGGLIADATAVSAGDGE